MIIKRIKYKYTYVYLLFLIVDCLYAYNILYNTHKNRETYQMDINAYYSYIKKTIFVTMEIPVTLIIFLKKLKFSET